MKYKKIVFIAFFLLLSLVYTWYEANRPRPVDWSETYSHKDKVPYGTYIAYHSLPQLFPESEIIASRLPVGQQLALYDTTRPGAYVVVNRRFEPGQADVLQLLDWVRGGNSLFVVAEQISDTLLNAFGISSKIGDNEGGTRLGEKVYRFRAGTSCYFEKEGDFCGKVLGVRVDDQRPDFVWLPYGEGQVFLNLNPRGFTNQWILDSLCGDYYYKVLSCLPDREQILMWDASADTAQQRTFLRVIFDYPGLTLALYLLMGATLLYVVFRAKREQRPIPVVKPPENKMLEFIATVSALYYRQKEHRTMAMKWIDFFLNEARARYHLHTDRLDESFARLLAERTGKDLQKAEQLVRLIVRIREGGSVDGKLLEQLMERTKEFIK